MRSRAADYNKAGPRIYFDHTINARYGRPAPPVPSRLRSVLPFRISEWPTIWGQSTSPSRSTRSSSDTGSRAPQQGIPMMSSSASTSWRRARQDPIENFERFSNQAPNTTRSQKPPITELSGQQRQVVWARWYYQKIDNLMPDE